MNGLGQFQFNVTSLVNDWISGNNTVVSIALTGKNDTSGNDFLQGFRNNSDTSANQGFSFLSVTAVPEPSSMFALAAGSIAAWVVRGRNKKDKGDITLLA